MNGVVCQKRGPLPGELLGAPCAGCGHMNIAHDDAGCAVCALRALAPAADPKPPTLREQVADYLRREVEAVDETDGQHLEWADAVLAVVAEWLAAQPLHTHADTIASCADQRGYDVRLLRGAS